MKPVLQRACGLQAELTSAVFDVELRNLRTPGLRPLPTSASRGQVPLPSRRPIISDSASGSTPMHQRSQYMREVDEPRRLVAESGLDVGSVRHQPRIFHQRVRHQPRVFHQVLGWVMKVLEQNGACVVYILNSDQSSSARATSELWKEGLPAVTDPKHLAKGY